MRAWVSAASFFLFVDREEKMEVGTIHIGAENLA